MIKTYLLHLLVSVLIAAPLYLLIRRPFRRGGRRELYLALFVLFHVGLFVLVLNGSYTNPLEMIRSAWQRIQSGEGINLVPFRTIARYFRAGFGENTAVNLIGNIIMFIPFGFGVPFFWKKAHTKLGLAAVLLCFTVLIECCQLFVGRFFDVDDMILNFLGGLIGAAVYYLFYKKYPSIRGFAQ